jgi:hypothetical protein
MLQTRIATQPTRQRHPSPSTHGLIISINVKPVWNASALPKKRNPFRVRQLSEASQPANAKALDSHVHETASGKDTLRLKHSSQGRRGLVLALRFVFSRLVVEAGRLFRSTAMAGSEILKQDKRRIWIDVLHLIPAARVFIESRSSLFRQLPTPFDDIHLGSIHGMLRRRA